MHWGRPHNPAYSSSGYCLCGIFKSFLSSSPVYSHRLKSCQQADNDTKMPLKEWCLILAFCSVLYCPLVHKEIKTSVKFQNMPFNNPSSSVSSSNWVRLDLEPVPGSLTAKLNWATHPSLCITPVRTFIHN